MAGIVDPTPLIRARLAELAAEHEPLLAQLRADVDAARTKAERRAAKRALRSGRRAYAVARAEVNAARGPGVRW